VLVYSPSSFAGIEEGGTANAQRRMRLSPVANSHPTSAKISNSFLEPRRVTGCFEFGEISHVAGANVLPVLYALSVTGAQTDQV
jgi:hypothetical protein